MFKIYKKEKEYHVSLTLEELQLIYKNIKDKEMSNRESLTAQQKIADALIKTDFYKNIT